MAKIGNLPEWISKELSEKPQMSQKESEMLLIKFNQSQQSLKSQIAELQKEIDLKNQQINLMSADFEPSKSNLLLKISLLCEKLQAVSSEGYEAWIQEIEVARLKARYNESTIKKLESSLGSHKRKILDLENKLRCFGVDPGDNLTSFDFNILLKNLFTVGEGLNSLIEKSEKNVLTVDLIMGNPSRAEEFKAKKEARSEFNHKDLGEAAKAINSKLAEISEKIALVSFFEGEQQGALSFFKDLGVKEMEKVLKTSIKAVRSTAETLNLISKTGHSHWRREHKQEAFKDSSFKNIKEMGNLLQELEKEHRSIVLPEKFEQFSDLKKLSRTLLKTVQNSEATLVDMSKISSADYHSILNERSIIVQQYGVGVSEELNFITKMTKLLKKHENFKQSMIQPLAGVKSEESHLVELFNSKQKIENQILEKLALLANLQFERQSGKNILEILEIEKSNLAAMQNCLIDLPDFKSILMKMRENSEKLLTCFGNLSLLQNYIAPGDLSLKESVEEAIKHLRSQTTTEDLSKSLSVHSSYLCQLSSILSDLHKSLPPCFPAIKELESIDRLMKESNLTIDILVKFYQKGEKYKKLVENTNNPELGPWVERNFADRWQFMLDYFVRVAEVGTHLEVVKRQILEDDLDFSRVKGTWDKTTKNLMRSERAIAKLVEVCPDEETVEKLGPKLSKISKNRAQNMRSIKNSNPSGLIVQDNLDNLAESAQELSDVLEEIVTAITGSNEEKSCEDGEISIIYKPLPVVDSEDLKNLCKTALENVIFTQHLLEGTEISEQDLKIKARDLVGEASGMSRALGYLQEQHEKLKILEDVIGELRKIEDKKNEEVKLIHDKSQELAEELKKDLERVLREKKDIDEKAEKLQNEKNELLGQLKKDNEAFLVEKNQLVRQAEGLRSELKELETRNKQFEGQLKNSEDLVKGLNEKLENAEKDNLSLNQNNQKLRLENEKTGENLNANFKEKVNEIEMLKRKLVESENKQHELNEKDNEIELLKRKLVESENKQHELNDKGNILQNQCSANEKLIQELKEKTHQLEKSIKTMQDSLKELEQLNDSLKSECAVIPNLHSKIESLQNTINSLKSENESLSKHSQAPRKESESKSSESSSSDDEKEQKSSKPAVEEKESKQDSSQLTQYYNEVLQNIQQKVGEILLKTDYVGDTLIEILPEQKLKEKMERFQEQFEEVIKRGPSEDNSTENNVFELLDLLDKYEAANGEQSSRLAGSSAVNASKDMESLAKGTKNSLSMKNKKNLRSGRPPVAPMNSYKNSLEEVKGGVIEILGQFSQEKVPSPEEFSEEVEYYTTITKKFTELSKELLRFFSELKELEIEREQIVIREVEGFIQLLDTENLGQLEVIRETYKKEMVTRDQSLPDVLMNCRLKLGVEKELSKIRLQSVEKKGSKINEAKVTETLMEVSKKSLETLKPLIEPEHFNKLKEEVFMFQNFILEEQILSCCKSLSSIEDLKQEKIMKMNDLDYLESFLNKLQQSIKRNFAVTESLWQFFIKTVGRESDKAFLKHFIFSLPTAESGNPKPTLTRSLEIFEELLEKNEKKIQEMLQRQEDLSSVVADNEENVDETIRKLLKDLVSLDDERSKKDLAKIKEEFEENCEKFSPSIYDKSNHISQGFVHLSKLQNLARKQVDSLRKTCKKLESDLTMKSTELENLTSQFEQERSGFKNRLDLAETSAKEAKVLCEKYSSDLSKKELELVALANAKNDLQLEIESKASEISQLSDEVSDLKSSVRSTRMNLKEKNEEITRLEEQISELQSRPVSKSDDGQVESLKNEIQALSKENKRLEKSLDQEHEDLLIVKRDKTLLALDLQKQVDTVRELREDMGKIKAKILIAENSARELEEKNKLGVDRNDKLISEVLQNLKEYKKENEILNRQIAPALNYRRLYSGVVGENDLNKQSAEQEKIECQALKHKLKQVQQLNEKLVHENQMMEKFKNEWLEARAECEVLRQKVEAYESPRIQKEGTQSALDDFTKNLKEAVAKRYESEEEKMLLSDALNESNELLKAVRKRNVFFKILMIGRIKCYYRFSTWHRFAEVPENLKFEDVDLVSLYTSQVNAVVPEICNPQAVLYIKEAMQRALLNCQVRSQYKKYPIKSDQLPKNTLFKQFYEFLIEKADFDSKFPENSKSVSSDFLQKLKEKFGTAFEATKYLGEFLPSLFYLYQERNPLSILFCKLLNYLDPTPIYGSNRRVILEALLQIDNICGLSQDSDSSQGKLETLGTVLFDQVLSILQRIFGNDTEEFFLASSQFDKNLTEMNGVDFLLNLSESLLAIKNKQTLKVLNEFGENDGLNFENFEAVIKKFKPELASDQLEKLFIDALKDSDDFTKVTVNGLLNVLENSKAEGFFIGAASKSVQFEEVKDEDKFLREQKSLTSESETLIHKKMIKKKLVKKKSNN